MFPAWKRRFQKVFHSVNIPYYKRTYKRDYYKNLKTNELRNQFGFCRRTNKKSVCKPINIKRLHKRPTKLPQVDEFCNYLLTSSIEGNECLIPKSASTERSSSIKGQ